MDVHYSGNGYDERLWGDIPKEKSSSFETMTVQKSDIEVPIKYSAKMKGQAAR